MSASIRSTWLYNYNSFYLIVVILSLPDDGVLSHQATPENTRSPASLAPEEYDEDTFLRQLEKANEPPSDYEINLDSSEENDFYLPFATANNVAALEAIATKTEEERVKAAVQMLALEYRTGRGDESVWPSAPSTVRHAAYDTPTASGPPFIGNFPAQDISPLPRGHGIAIRVESEQFEVPPVAPPMLALPHILKPGGGLLPHDLIEHFPFGEEMWCESYCPANNNYFQYPLDGVSQEHPALYTIPIVTRWWISYILYVYFGYKAHNESYFADFYQKIHSRTGQAYRDAIHAHVNWSIERLTAVYTGACTIHTKERFHSASFWVGDGDAFCHGDAPCSPQISHYVLRVSDVVRFHVSQPWRNDMYRSQRHVTRAEFNDPFYYEENDRLGEWPMLSDPYSDVNYADGNGSRYYCQKSKLV
jgi:hypothetical protein